MGPISGNLCACDVDCPDIADQFLQALKLICPELPRLTALIQTPRDGGRGRQLICRLPDVPPGNERFASQLELGPDGQQQVRTQLESRGSGGYVVAVGSPANVHLAGVPYEQLGGCPLTLLQPISCRQFGQIRAVAQLFNQIETEQSEYVRQDRNGQEPRPGDTFNAHADWTALLVRAGWVETHRDDDISYWRRPGKEVGWSARLGYFQDADGRPLLSVFSTSTPLGPRNGRGCRVVAPFDFLAVIFHGAD